MNLQEELDQLNSRIRHAKITREGLEAHVRDIQDRIEILTLEIENNQAKAKRLYSADVPK